MKKFLLFISLNATLVVFAQNSISIKNTSNSATIAANGTVHVATTAGNVVGVTFDIKNISASTQTYVLKRYDMTLNTNAVAFFCFAGTCFGAATIESGSITLTPGQSASDYTTAYQMLTADLEEGPTVGQSTVKYSFKNVNVAADSLQMVLRYNDPTASIKEYTNEINGLDVYPNPANDHISISFSSKGSNTGEISLINALGQTVYTKQVALNEGKNRLNVQLNELPKGIYFAKVKNGNNQVSTKKIIVQ
jgi:hypothetical protein